MTAYDYARERSDAAAACPHDYGLSRDEIREEEAWHRAEVERNRARRWAEQEAARAMPAVCPECRDGKCRNCTGAAWDDAADELTACGCRHGEGG